MLEKQYYFHRFQAFARMPYLQVQQVKKIARFSCSLCGKKQSVQRVSVTMSMCHWQGSIHLDLYNPEGL